jgi:hypothetical protein
LPSNYNKAKKKYVCIFLTETHKSSALKAAFLSFIFFLLQWQENLVVRTNLNYFLLACILYSYVSDISEESLSFNVPLHVYLIFFTKLKQNDSFVATAKKKKLYEDIDKNWRFSLQHRKYAYFMKNICCHASIEP